MKTRQVSVVSDTLCPFLFQTQTIHSQRCLSFRRRNHHGKRSTSTSTRASESAEPRPSVFRQKAPAVQAQNTVIASTITAEERRIFENIKRKFGGTIDHISNPSLARQRLGSGSETLQEPINAVSRPSLQELDINNILSLFASSSLTEANETENYQPKISQDEVTSFQPVRPHRIRAAAFDSLQDIAKSIRSSVLSTTTPPDHALWRKIEAKVFPLISILQSPVLRPSLLSQTAARNEPFRPLTVEDITSTLSNPRFRTSNKLDLNALTNIEPDIPVLSFITIFYPAATLLALRTYAAYLPTSAFALALLPKIKELGPTSYLLAGNTHFFNTLIQLYWDIYSDFNAITSLLQDMQQDGVDFDSTTLALLKSVIGQRNQVVNAQIESRNDSALIAGRTASWWRMKFQQKPLEKIEKHWIPVISHEINRPRAEVDDLVE